MFHLLFFRCLTFLSTLLGRLLRLAASRPLACPGDSMATSSDPSCDLSASCLPWGQSSALLGPVWRPVALPDLSACPGDSFAPSSAPSGDPSASRTSPLALGTVWRPPRPRLATPRLVRPSANPESSLRVYSAPFRVSSAPGFLHGVR